MTFEEAKFLLSARRPGEGDDESDPRMAAAMRLAESEPELRAWYAKERTFDAALRAGLGRVRAPAGLRERIRAGGMVVDLPRRATWTRWVIAAAAALVLGLGVFGFVQSRSAKSGPSLLLSELSRYLEHEWDHVFDLPTADYGKVRDWLATKEQRVELNLPERLSGSPTYGCKVFSWRGHEATLVCFQPKEAGGVVHVVSVPVSSLPEFTSELPQYGSAGSWNSAMWRARDRIYVALTTADRASLMKSL